MRKGILFVFFLLTAVHAEASPELDMLQKAVRDLQTQMADYKIQMDRQSQMIEVQGKEIAELKNKTAPSPSLPSPFILQGEGKGGGGVRKEEAVKIGGWYQEDVNLYDRGNEGSSRFKNRRARLDIKGSLGEDFDYRFYPEFASETQFGRLVEAWLSYKHFENAKLKLGQMKVPFSLESQYSALWLDFVERAIGVTNLQPLEDVGAMVFAGPFDGRVEYGLGVFNGRLRPNEDNNDNFDVAGRLVFAPFLKRDHSLFREIYFGGSITAGHSDETLAGTGFTTAGGNRFLTYSTGTRHADTRTRYAGEFQWIYGHGDIKAEYLGAHFDNVERLGVKDDVNVDSWYLSGTYVLTGERKMRNKGIEPKRSFSPAERGWGAWEAALRFEQFLLDSAPVNLGLAAGTDQVNAYTAGLNWWLNTHIRLMFDYVVNDFSDSVQIGGEQQESEHLWLSRAQVQF